MAPLSRWQRFQLWVSEFGYWHVTRHVQTIPFKIARKLPNRIRYWVIIDTASKQTDNYQNITWLHLVNQINKERENG